ncbi:MAG: glycogen synthase GlgA [Deltaproteobacteria bacterium]|nr:glycogen synthase GlgA [Deltaproteobacteria bacterium]
MVSPEIAPLAKTGGLADAVGALARALVDLGSEVTLVMPAYRTVLENVSPLQETGIEVEVPIAGRSVRGVILRTRVGERLPAFLIRADSYFLRDGLYGNPQGDYADNAERFVFFCKATLELARRTAPWDVLHCHDWQTALVPVLRKVHGQLYSEIQETKALFTVHNLAHQGNFPFSVWDLLGLEMQYFTPRYLEFYGNINLLKGGILFADAMTTVSKKYASEIRTPEWGCGLDGVIRDREKDLYGILNGVDYQEWNPETDPDIKKKYQAKNLIGKKFCKKDLQEIYGLPDKASIPLVGVVSRLVDQKGLDILNEAVEDLMHLDLQLVILGAGDQRYQALLDGLPGRYPEKVGVRIGFDNALAHKIEAGADIFLMPSKFEPCGLNQMYSLKYGTIPVVRATGGLDDTIEDYNPLSASGNGFKFSGYSGPTLLEAVKRAITLYVNKPAWRRLMAGAMACDFSWEKSANEYLALYQKLIERGGPH